MNRKTILAADIGGTSSRFGLFFADTDADELEKGADIWLETKRAASFGELLKQLRASSFPYPEAVDIASVAAAGPVEAQRICRPPQISWTIDFTRANEEFHFPRTVLINDFVAQAYACCSPLVSKAQQILPGKKAELGTIAVVGAGTGFGKAAVIPLAKGRFTAIPSEGGHVNFSPENAREFEFQQFVAARMKIRYPTWDDVVSGKGLSSIHAFLAGEELSPQEVAERFSNTSETLIWAARFYGRVCRNFVLETLAVGGLYIAGGIAAKNPLLVTHQAFTDEFRNPRTHKAVLENVPVYLMTDEETGLWGAGFAGQQALKAGG